MIPSWIKEGNQGVETRGDRMVMKENRPRQVASSLVIYMKSAGIGKFGMGRKLCRTIR